MGQTAVTKSCDIAAHMLLGRLLLGDEWGVTTFLSYFFSHSMYLRPAYRFNKFPDGSDEHQALVQFVWGLGPHAHRLED